MMDKSIIDERKAKIRQGGSRDRNHRWGQLCEILAVIGVAGAVFLAVLKFDSLWMVFDSLWMVVAAILFFGAFALFRLAIIYAAAAEKEVQEVARNTRYAATPERIETLTEVGAAKDAVNVLRYFDQPEFTEDELVGKLADRLGSERANEVKGVILKYTRMDPKKQSTDPAPEVSAT
jgi:energy-coupling factor transporter transmembrane protein EcfT